MKHIFKLAIAVALLGTIGAAPCVGVTPNTIASDGYCIAGWYLLPNGGHAVFAEAEKWRGTCGAVYPPAPKRTGAFR